MQVLVKRLLLPGAPIVLFLAVWHFSVALGWAPRELLPGPMAVLDSLVQLVTSGVLLDHASASLFRVSLSFVLAAVTAIPIGLVLGWYETLGRTFGYTIELFRTISPISWIPLAILWFGIGNEPAIFILFMSAFFPMLIASRNAVAQVEPTLLRVAQNFGARGLTLVLKVVLPASTPYIFVGMRISLGIAWVVVVAAEMAGLRSGLGYLILDARYLLRTDVVIAGMVAIGLIGLALDQVMKIAEAILARRGLLAAENGA